MPILQVQDEFQSGDNVTATSLNNLVEQASFDSGAVDNATLQIDTLGSGYLKVKDNGILSNHLKSDASDSNDAQRAVTTNHIRNDAVTNAKIANLAVDTAQIAADAVTYAKIQNVSTTDRVLGRDSAGAGNVEEISPAALRTMINVEDGATADQTASEIKTAYESNNDTNAFTDAEQTKLTGIETGATADQSASEIKTAYESNSDTNAFTDAEKTKLTGIATGAEVNVQSDWTASSGDAFIKNKPNIAYTSAISNATTSADGLMSSTDKTKLNGIAAGAEVNPSNATPHTGGTADSDGLKTTGGADGLLSAYDKTKLNSIAVNANNYSHPTGDGNLHVPATSNTNHRKLLTAGPTAGSLSWAHNNEALVGVTYTNEIAKASSGAFGVTINVNWPTFQSSSITATRSGRNAWIVGTYVLNTTYPSISNDDAYFMIEMPNSWKAYNTNTAVHYSHGWHRAQTTSSNSSLSSIRQRHAFAEVRGIPSTTDDGIVLFIERESGRYLSSGTFYVSFLLDDTSMNS